MAKDNKKKLQRSVLLEITNASKKYRYKDSIRTIFEKFNLTVLNSDLIGVIGKSGTGKTLLMQCIIGIEEFDEGNIVYQGKNFKDITKKERENLLKSDFSIVLREENLFGFLTVQENLRVLSDIKIKNIDSENEIIDLLEIDDVLNKNVDELSWLDYQKVSLALALISKPKIIFLDEPTGNLNDNETEEFMKYLKLSISKFNVACIVFSHDSKVALSINKIVRI